MFIDQMKPLWVTVLVRAVACLACLSQCSLMVEAYQGGAPMTTATATFNTGAADMSPQNVQQQQEHKQETPLSTIQSTRQQTRRSIEWDSSKPKKKQCLCPPDELDLDLDSADGTDEGESRKNELSTLDRQEAAFATLGRLWADGSIPTDALFASSNLHGLDVANTELDMASIVEGFNMR